MIRATYVSTTAVVALVALIAGCADPPAASIEPEEGEAPQVATPPTAPAQSTPQPTPTRGAGVRVASVADGDTIRLADGRRVRLVQIDTPEVHGGAECGGRAASSALKAQLPAGTRVRLEPDPATDATDGYGRLLRYVYLGQRNLNVWLVARGHAAPYFYDGQRGRFATQLDRAARRAKASGIGFWGACPKAILDAYRGVSTGLVGSAATSDAASGAAQLQPGRANLPLAPAGGPDIDCADLPGPVRVTPGDPHRLDRDGDGIGCDS